MRYAPGAGATRMRPVFVTGMPEPTPVHGQLWDTKLGVRCDASGERCRPLGAASVSDGYFSDAQCTKPVVAMDSCSVETGFGAEFSPGGSGYFRLRGRYQGPLWKGRAGACAPFETTEPKVFVLADRLEETDFAEIKDLQDP